MCSSRSMSSSSGRGCFLVLVVQVDESARGVERPAHELVAQPRNHATRDERDAMDGARGGPLGRVRHRRGVPVERDVPALERANNAARCAVGERAGELEDGEEECEAWREGGALCVRGWVVRGDRIRIRMTAPALSLPTPHAHPSHPRPAIPRTSLIHCATARTSSRLCACTSGSRPRNTSFHACVQPADACDWPRSVFTGPAPSTPSSTSRTFSAGAAASAWVAPASAPDVAATMMGCAGSTDSRYVDEKEYVLHSTVPTSVFTTNGGTKCRGRMTNWGTRSGSVIRRRKRRIGIGRTPSLFTRLRIYFGVKEAPSRSAAPRRDVHPLTGEAKVHIHQKEIVGDIYVNIHTLCRSEKSYRAREVNSSPTSQRPRYSRRNSIGIFFDCGSYRLCLRYYIRVCSIHGRCRRLHAPWQGRGGDGRQAHGGKVSQTMPGHVMSVMITLAVTFEA
jgi:hypothetical protein